MSTRSMICKELPNGKYRSIYCHWDGYPEYNGVILNDIYNNSELVDKLLELGNLSSLGVNLEPNKGTIHTFDEPQKNVCIAYDRDRKEKDQDAKDLTLKELFNNSWIEYFYIFTLENKWIYSDSYFTEKSLKQQDEASLRSTFKDLGALIDEICPIEERKQLKACLS